MIRNQVNQFEDGELSGNTARPTTSFSNAGVMLATIGSLIRFLVISDEP
jgi:hypothetical protein